MPLCPLGYTEAQIAEIMGDRLQEFRGWMDGQTMAICDGRRYDHDKRKYESTGEGPHGGITYASDVKRFLAGLPVID